MSNKHIPLILLIPAIVFVVRTTYLERQVCFQETIINNTRESVSVEYKYWRDESASNIASETFAKKLGESLSGIAVVPASHRKKYAYCGSVVFKNKAKVALQLDCYGGNIVRVNKRFYVTSCDIFETVRTLCEVEMLSETEDGK